MTFMPEEGALGYTVIALIIILSTFVIQRYSGFETQPWHALVVVIVSLLAIVASGAFQTREIWRLLFLPVGALISGIINFSVYFIRTRNRKEAAGAEGPSVQKPWLKYITAGLAAAFILPLIIAVYMRFFLPPIVEPGWASVRYDYSLKYDWDEMGKRNPGQGLYIEYDVNERGDHNVYDWVVTAYLVTSTTGLWDEGYYVRRARFSDRHSFVTNYGIEGREYECPRYACDLFLPYDVVLEGKRQGDFKNYRPEPLRDILSSNDNVYFGVELITVVSGSRDGKAVEGEQGTERRKMIPLNASSTWYGDENYLNSRWASMTSDKAPPVQVPEEAEIEATPPPEIQLREEEDEVDRSEWDIF